MSTLVTKVHLAKHSTLALFHAASIALIYEMRGALVAIYEGKTLPQEAIANPRNAKTLTRLSVHLARAA